MGVTAILFLLTFAALRCSRVSFLLHGVEYLVAILSLVLVRETDDSHLSAIFILCVHITKLIFYCVYCQNSMYTKTLF